MNPRDRRDELGVSAIGLPFRSAYGTRRVSVGKVTIGGSVSMADPATEILAWYDSHARDLPWRVPPNENRRPDPYHVWLSEIMLQQTTVAAVVPYFNRFLVRWPTVADLAAADDADVMAEWAGLGYYARARNLLKSARIVALAGSFPQTEAALRTLPGVGPYTAAAIAAIAYGHPAVVVDGNVERVMARLHALRDPLPGVKTAMRAKAAEMTPKHRAGDYAQAVMDLGAGVCTPTAPACPDCPWTDRCQARALGIAEALPVRAAKTPKPRREGHVYVGIRADGAVLLERRAETGLLGGMLGFPGSPWADRSTQAPPLAANWRALPTTVTHVFTHFRLELTVHVAHLPMDAAGTFTAPHAFSDAHLPTVFRKVWRVAFTELAEPAE